MDNCRYEKNSGETEKQFKKKKEKTEVNILVSGLIERLQITEDLAPRFLKTKAKESLLGSLILSMFGKKKKRKHRIASEQMVFIFFWHQTVCEIYCMKIVFYKEQYVPKD